MIQTADELKELVTKYGELFVVLESDREYEIHGTSGYDILHEGDPTTETVVKIEGMQGDEYLIVEIPLDAIEHIYTHREV